jgi:hypothetical protein
MPQVLSRIGIYIKHRTVSINNDYFVPGRVFPLYKRLLTSLAYIGIVGDLNSTLCSISLCSIY